MQWREAATLILASRMKNGSPNLSADKLKILTLKRSKSAKFMPNAVVFPGGVVDKSDFNRDWLELLSRQDKPLPAWKKSIPKPMTYEVNMQLIFFL